MAAEAETPKEKHGAKLIRQLSRMARAAADEVPLNDMMPKEQFQPYADSASSGF